MARGMPVGTKGDCIGKGSEICRQGRWYSRNGGDNCRSAANCLDRIAGFIAANGRVSGVAA